MSCCVDQSGTPCVRKEPEREKPARMTLRGSVYLSPPLTDLPSCSIFLPKKFITVSSDHIYSTVLRYKGFMKPTLCLVRMLKKIRHGMLDDGLLKSACSWTVARPCGSCENYTDSISQPVLNAKTAKSVWKFHPVDWKSIAFRVI